MSACCCLARPYLAVADASGDDDILNNGSVSATSAAGLATEESLAATAALCTKWGLQPTAVGTEPPRVFDFFLASQ